MSAAYSNSGMGIALRCPEQCHEEVTRAGELEPCNKVAVALRLDPQESEPYPVCAHHARGDMVPLEAIVRFLLDEQHQRLASSVYGSVSLDLIGALDSLKRGARNGGDR